MDAPTECAKKDAVEDPAQLNSIAKSCEILKLDLELSYCRDLNIRETTIREVHHALKNKEITAVELTEIYLKRIEALNPYLNAVIEVNPDAVQIARELDKEQFTSGLRGPLHGIPILIKGNIGTKDKMETCAGSLALVGLKPKEDSEVVKRVRAAGAIILGKANLSEFANFRGEGIPSGWSGRGKQTKNPYVLGKDPSGSSSGSTVAVAANLCLVSLGTETDGSIVSPASHACVIGLKPTVGLVPSTCVIPLASSQDSVGPVARTVQDAALLFNVISNNHLKSSCFDLENPDFKNLFKRKLKVGVWRNRLWDYVEEPQKSEGEKVLQILRIADVSVEDPIEAPTELLEKITPENELATLHCEFKSGLNEYLATAVCAEVGANGECNAIQCLTDIIEFNRKNPVPENYNQKELEAANATEGISDPNYIEKRNTNRNSSRKLIDDLLSKYELDAIVAPIGPGVNATGFYPAVSGYPIITIPTGFGSDGVPFGMGFFGTANSEEKLLMIAARLEAAYKVRRTPLYQIFAEVKPTEVTISGSEVAESESNGADTGDGTAQSLEPKTIVSDDVAAPAP